jgi:hypothetical protein
VPIDLVTPRCGIIVEVEDHFAGSDNNALSAVSIMSRLANHSSQGFGMPRWPRCAPVRQSETDSNDPGERNSTAAPSASPTASPIKQQRRRSSIVILKSPPHESENNDP